MKNNELVITIIGGLPCSGKTSYAKNIIKDRTNTLLLSIDNYIVDGIVDSKYLRRDINYFIDKNDTYTNSKKIVIEGLFYNNKTLIDFINDYYVSLFKNKYNFKIEIIQFEEDKQTCLWNNKGLKSDRKVDINNLKYESFDKELILKETKLKDLILNTRKVFRKPYCSIIADTHNIYYDSEFIMKSDTWVTSGYFVDCWGNSGEISADPEDSFIELRKLLVNILLLEVNDNNLYCHDVNAIISSVTCVDEFSEYGYYGGHTTYNFYYVDLIYLDKYLSDNLKIYKRKKVIETITST